MTNLANKSFGIPPDALEELLVTKIRLLLNLDDEIDNLDKVILKTFKNIKINDSNFSK